MGRNNTVRNQIPKKPTTRNAIKINEKKSTKLQNKTTKKQQQQQQQENDDDDEEEEDTKIYKPAFENGNCEEKASDGVAHRSLNKTAARPARDLSAIAKRSSLPSRNAKQETHDDSRVRPKESRFQGLGSRVQGTSTTQVRTSCVLYPYFVVGYVLACVYLGVVGLVVQHSMDM